MMRGTTIFALLALAAAAGLGLVRATSALPPLEPRPRSTAFADTDDTSLGRAVAPRAAAHPGLSGIFPLPEALDAFAARALLARAAERSIDAQYYIWHDDLTGALLFDELRAAADRGVRVRLLLDDNNTAGMDARLAALDAHPGIEVRLFNPFVIRAPRLLGFLTDFARLNRRMHNKSFTVDGQATIIGGRNIGDAYFGASDGALFVDLDVLAAGPVARQVADDFDRYWASASAYPAARILRPDRDVGAAPAASAESIRRDPRAAAYLRALRDRPFVADLIAGRLTLDWVPVRMLSDDPAKGLGRAARDELLAPRLRAILGEPRQSLGLVSGYFVPTEGGTAAFAGLARHGVEVTILTNSLAATDVPIVHAGYAKWRKPLLAAGVRLYEMRAPVEGGPGRPAGGVGSRGSRLGGPGAALHAKTFAVDRTRLFVGSFNFDPRSVHLNTELGFVIDSPALAERIRATLADTAPEAAYELRLTDGGDLVWIERRAGRKLRHATEPGTTAWQRALVALLSRLPIDGLL